MGEVEKVEVEANEVAEATEDTVALLIRALESDEIIRRAIRFTAVKALQHANEMLDRGSVANRVTVIRSMMPALVKTLERKETDDELKQLKAELHDLMAEVRSGIKDTTPLDDTSPDTPQ